LWESAAVFIAALSLGWVALTWVKTRHIGLSAAADLG
jgi:hypothetical protein